MLVCYFGCWISIENLLLMAANLLSSVFSLTLVTNPIMQGILRRSNDRTHEQCPLLSGSENGKRGRYVLALLFLRLCMHQKIFFFFRAADKDLDTTWTLSEKTQGPHRVFEPGYPDDPDHDAPDDCAQPEQHELCGGEALVGCAVGARALGCCAGTLRRDAVIPNLSENKVRD